MSNLLAKWAVNYSKFSKIGIVDLDGPLIAFQCHMQPQCHLPLSRYCTLLIRSTCLDEKQNGCDEKQNGSKMGRKFEQKRKAKWVKKKRNFGQGLIGRGSIGKGIIGKGGALGGGALGWGAWEGGGKH